MTFDSLAMHAVRDELESSLLGGHVEKVIPLSPLEVGLRVRSQRHDFNLLMSADAQAARVHLVSGTLRRLSDEVSPFILLLRKYVRDGRIVSLEQPALERVLRITVETRQDDGSVVPSALIIEVMGRHSNVILVGADGKVMDALKRVPPSLSRQRPVLPHLLYSPPPAIEKMSPLVPFLAGQLAAAARQADPAAALWRFLQETLAGLGPLAAREIAFRAGGNASASLAQVTSWEAVAGAVQALFGPLQTKEWSPCVVVRDGVVVHFAAYRLTQFPEAEVEGMEGISPAMERAYAEGLRLRPAEAVRAPLRAGLEAKLERVRRKEESLRQALGRGEKAGGLKMQGRAILASVGSLVPGQKELTWEGEIISLDPTLSPSENAQHYFKEYTKARDAAREIPALLEAVGLERDYLELMLTHVELAEDQGGLRAISRELAEAAEGQGADSAASTGKKSAPAGRGKGRQKSGRPDQTPGTVKQLTSSEGHQILVGGSAKGNERATFDLAGPGDLWLHARGIPGAHVILKLGGQQPSRDVLLEAARVAARHSQARGGGRVQVDYTLQRHVKKVKGGPPGLVTYREEKTVRVDAASEEPG